MNADLSKIGLTVWAKTVSCSSPRGGKTSLTLECEFVLLAFPLSWYMLYDSQLEKVVGIHLLKLLHSHRGMVSQNFLHLVKRDVKNF